MTDAINLNGHHRTTLERIYSHPINHNLEWHDVISLLGKVGTVDEQANGHLAITVGDQSVVIPEPKGNDIEVEQLIQIRHLLEGAGIAP